MDWTMVVVALIHELPAILIAAASVVTAALTWRNSHKIEEIHTATNGMSKVINAASKQEGIMIGLAQGRAEESKGGPS